MLVEFMRRKGLALRELDQLPPGVGFLLVEMGAWSRRRSPRQGRILRARLAFLALLARRSHLHAGRGQVVWHVRESALGAMVFVPGEPDRWEGWEDAAVPPAQLGKYLRAITSLMAEYGYRSPALRPLRPGLRPHAHQFRLPQRRTASAAFANSSIARIESSSPLAARFPASTATAKRAPPCCPKCLGPSSSRPFASSRSSGIPTTA